MAETGAKENPETKGEATGYVPNHRDYIGDHDTPTDQNANKPREALEIHTDLCEISRAKTSQLLWQTGRVKPRHERLIESRLWLFPGWVAGTDIERARRVSLEWGLFCDVPGGSSSMPKENSSCSQNVNSARSWREEGDSDNGDSWLLRRSMPTRSCANVCQTAHAREERGPGKTCLRQQS